ncbi:MAG: FAD-dependent oxidoreductase [Desulfobacteraceae bacterium]
MGKDLILLGGGHAHMVTLANIGDFVRQGHRVTVIGPSEHHYYSGMGPGMLSQTYTPQQIRFNTRRTVEKNGGRFIKDRASHIDPDRRIVYAASGDTFPYDVLSCNTGSQVPDYMIEGSRDKVFTTKPIEGMITAQEALLQLAKTQSKTRVAVVGGGAAGIEVAGNAWSLLSKNGRHRFEVVLFSEGKLLPRFPDKVRKAVLGVFLKRGIKILENNKVDRIGDHVLLLKSGKRYRADLIFIAIGVKPSPIFAASRLPTGPLGALAVNEYLQCSAYPQIFGGGDCIYFENHPLNKVGVYAVRQNPILYQNLMASLAGQPLTPFSPGGAYLLVFNLGKGIGVYYKQGIAFKGRLAFLIKDLIDRRFIRKFQ